MFRSLPHLPRRAAGVPHIFQQLPLPISVHRLPEAVVPVHHQLSIRRQPLKRLSLEAEVLPIIEVAIDKLALEHEEASVDEPFGYLRLFGERSDPPGVQFEFTESARRTHARNRSELAVRAMEVNQLRDVHVTETVSVGQAERSTIQITTDPINARPGHRRFAGLGQSDAPAVLGVAVMKLNRA